MVVGERGGQAGRRGGLLLLHKEQMQMKAREGRGAAGRSVLQMQATLERLGASGKPHILATGGACLHSRKEGGQLEGTRAHITRDLK